MAKNLQWECFIDESYFQLYCVRNKDDKQFESCFHLPNKIDAKQLCNILNKYHNKGYFYPKRLIN